MNRNLVVMVASISGIIGIITGMAFASCYWLKFGNVSAQISAASRTETAILTEVALLEQLRSGHYRDATIQIEAQLDSDLIGAGALVRDGARLGENVLAAVETERRARNLSGYQPANARISTSVHEAFFLVSHPETSESETFR